MVVEGGVCEEQPAATVRSQARLRVAHFDKKATVQYVKKNPEHLKIRSVIEGSTYPSFGRPSSLLTQMFPDFFPPRSTLAMLQLFGFSSAS